MCVCVHFGVAYFVPSHSRFFAVWVRVSCTLHFSSLVPVFFVLCVFSLTTHTHSSRACQVVRVKSCVSPICFSESCRKQNTPEYVVLVCSLQENTRGPTLRNVLGNHVPCIILRAKKIRSHHVPEFVPRNPELQSRGVGFQL